jgi:beta-glucosidase
LQVLEDEETSKKVQVTLQIKNVGSMVAAEVVQCYIRDCEASVYRPRQELKSFSKVRLEVGETKEVCLILGIDAFSFYDVGVSDWVVEPGAFEIRIGSSSRDIRLQGTIDLQTGKPASHLAVTAYPPIRDEQGNYNTLKDVNDATFTRRFGIKANLLTYEPNEPDVGFHRNSLLKEIASSRLIGKILLFVVSREAAKEIKRGPSRKRQMKMVRANVENLPLRVLVLFSEGSLTFRMLDTLIATMNCRVLESILGLPQSFVGMFKRE